MRKAAKRAALAICLFVTVGAASAGAQQAKGALGIAAARRGGVVLACRHGITGRTNEDEMTLRYEDPSTQRRLSAAGDRQVEALGKAFRALPISVVEVIASPMQRARRTAEVAFGEPKLDSTWHTRGSNYGGPKRDLRLEVLARPLTGGVRAIVSHTGTLLSTMPTVRGAFEEGDCVVVRPMGGTRFEVVEVVPWRAWLQAAGVRVPTP